MCLLRLYDSEPFLGEHFNPAQTDKQKRNVKRTHNIMEEQKIKRFLPTISLFSQLINIYIYFSLSHVGCAFVRFFFILFWYTLKEQQTNRPEKNILELFKYISNIATIANLLAFFFCVVYCGNY